jgi:hypothetical protein
MKKIEFESRRIKKEQETIKQNGTRFIRKNRTLSQNPLRRMFILLPVPVAADVLFVAADL